MADSEENLWWDLGEWKGEYNRSKQVDYGTVAIISFISLFFEIAWAKSEEHALLYNLLNEIFPTSNNWLCHSISISTQPKLLLVQFIQ